MISLKETKEQKTWNLKQQRDWLNIIPNIGCETENVNVTKVIEEDKDDDVNNLSDETVPDDNTE